MKLLAILIWLLATVANADCVPANVGGVYGFQSGGYLTPRPDGTQATFQTIGSLAFNPVTRRVGYSYYYSTNGNRTPVAFGTVPYSVQPDCFVRFTLPSPVGGSTAFFLKLRSPDRLEVARMANGTAMTTSGTFGTSNGASMWRADFEEPPLP
jgi:hypothetical protein